MRTRSAFIALFLAGTLNAQWSQVNSGFGTLVYGAAVHGATPTHLFARAYNVLYRSADHGDTWTAVTNPSAGGPSDLGFYFNDRYFAGSSAIGTCIHFTDDEGDTWTPATGAPSATVVRGFFEYGGALYAYTSSAGIYRTVNGTTWSAVNNGLTNLNVIGMASAGPAFLAATDGGGVFRTMFADTWTASTGIGSGDLDGEKLWDMGGSQYYAAQGGAMYRSVDLGQSWTAWTPPAFYGTGLVEVKRFGSTMYMETRHFAGGQRDSLYRSTNNGMAWTNITGNLDPADIHGSGLFEHDGYAYIGYGMGSAGEGIYRYALSTAVADMDHQEAVTVFPNPSSADVSITLPPGYRGVRYTLHDALGVQIHSGSVMSSALTVDLTTVAPGCYLLRWDDARLAPARLVKR